MDNSSSAISKHDRDIQIISEGTKRLAARGQGIREIDWQKRQRETDALGKQTMLKQLSKLKRPDPLVGFTREAETANKQDAIDLFQSPRGQYIMAQALVVAIERMKQADYPEHSNIANMEKLGTLFEPYFSTWFPELTRSLPAVAPEKAAALAEFCEELCSGPCLDSRARRAAKREGLVAKRSRKRVDGRTNCGGFRLIERGIIMGGERYDLTAEEIIKFCSLSKSRREFFG